MPGSRLSQRMSLGLTELEKQGRMRELRAIQGVNLCSNDYLGLAADLRLRAALIQGIEQCKKIGSTGSRLLSGHHSAWDSLEEEFAAFVGAPASLFFNSGFAANIGLVPALLEPHDLVFSDALNHASIIDGIRLSRAQKVIYPHCDLNALEDALRRHSSRNGARVIVTESIFSMAGDRAPLAEIFQLAETHGAEVIVDEAHAIAVCGPGGRGLVAECELQARALAIVYTCGKALASPGAFVCGSAALKRTLFNRARSFIFSTALPPYVAAQVRAALRMAVSMYAERAHLSALAADLRRRLRGAGFDCGASNSHIVPLIVGGNEAALYLAAELERWGFGVRAIRSPSVRPGTERLRISLTASLSHADIEHFTDAVACLSTLGAGRG